MVKRKKNDCCCCSYYYFGSCSCLPALAARGTSIWAWGDKDIMVFRFSFPLRLLSFYRSTPPTLPPVLPRPTNKPFKPKHIFWASTFLNYVLPPLPLQHILPYSEFVKTFCWKLEWKICNSREYYNNNCNLIVRGFIKYLILMVFQVNF